MGSYHIQISIQSTWGLILDTGLYLLPESPRFSVEKDQLDRVRAVLCKLRGQPEVSNYITSELAESVANAEHEREVIPTTGNWSSWLQCFSGSLLEGSGNLCCTILGASLQMMWQWTGVNFIFHLLAPFLESTGVITTPFFISLIFILVCALHPYFLLDQ